MKLKLRDDQCKWALRQMLCRCVPKALIACNWKYLPWDVLMFQAWLEIQ